MSPAMETSMSSGSWQPKRIYSWWMASGWMMPAIAESQWPAGHAFSGVMPCTNEFHLHHCSNWALHQVSLSPTSYGWKVTPHLVGNWHYTGRPQEILYNLETLDESSRIQQLWSINSWTMLDCVIVCLQKSGLPKSKDIIQNEASLRRPSCYIVLCP